MTATVTARGGRCAAVAGGATRTWEGAAWTWIEALAAFLRGVGAVNVELGGDADAVAELAPALEARGRQVVVVEGASEADGWLVRLAAATRAAAAPAPPVDPEPAAACVCGRGVGTVRFDGDDWVCDDCAL